MAENGMNELLQQTLEALDVLEKTLREESDVLTSRARDAAAIDAIALRKQQLVTEINNMVRNGDRILINNGLAPGREGVESWLKHLPTDHPALGIWHSILDTSARCKELNEINGVQINLLNRSAQEALTILLGDAGGSDTYGPNGSGRFSASPFRTTYTA